MQAAWRQATAFIRQLSVAPTKETQPQQIALTSLESAQDQGRLLRHQTQILSPPNPHSNHIPSRLLSKDTSRHSSPCHRKAFKYCAVATVPTPFQTLPLCLFKNQKVWKRLLGLKCWTISTWVQPAVLGLWKVCSVLTG